ncbi:hypothetical protein [Streptomyces sp. 7N604]|uniref:hypothetical protein n=1 Tax=Streptomyces sp. 7N604 TaxID=3457415 RepID=UPI003FD425FA
MNTRLCPAQGLGDRAAAIPIPSPGLRMRQETILEVGVAERLAVDGDELGHFIKLLKKSTDSLKGLRKALSDATVTGLGTDNLDSACEDFQNDWKYGAEQIGEQTEELAKIVGESKDSYREVDKALEEALKKGKGKGGRSGDAK